MIWGNSRVAALFIRLDRLEPALSLGPLREHEVLLDFLFPVKSTGLGDFPVE
jgi:hypothetical protein